MKIRDMNYSGFGHLFIGVRSFLLAILATCLLVPAYLYSFLYALYLLFTLKSIKAPFVFIWSLIDGTISTVGWLFYQLGVFLDYLWNIWGGEAIEDMVTVRENTNFAKRRITVSAACGKEIIDGHFIKSREWFSKFINRVFGQKNHFVGAEKYRLAKKEIDEEDFYETIKK